MAGGGRGSRRSGARSGAGCRSGGGMWYSRYTCLDTTFYCSIMLFYSSLLLFYHTLSYHTILSYHIILYHTTILYHTISYHTVLYYHTIPYHTIYHILFLISSYMSLFHMMVPILRARMRDNRKKLSFSVSVHRAGLPAAAGREGFPGAAAAPLPLERAAYARQLGAICRR